MKRAFALWCVAALAVGAAKTSLAADEQPKTEQPKKSDCTFLRLNGVGAIDEHTAILEMSPRVSAQPEHRRWFKVTFVSSCGRLGGARYFDLDGAGCPRHGDIVVFSRRPRPRDDQDLDSCTIDTAEEVPRPGGDAATPQ